MSTIGIAAIKETIQVLNAANALLTLKGVKTEEQTAAGLQSGRKDQDDIFGLDLIVKALVLLQKPQSTNDMSNSPQAPSNELSSDDNNQNESDLSTPKSNAKQNSPTAQNTSEDDVNDSDLRTETSGSLSSCIAPFTSDDDINNSGLPTPETSTSQTSSNALHTSDDDVNDPELQSPELNTSQTPPNPIYLTENLKVACPHCKELFSLKNAEISPDKNLIVPKKEDSPQANQESVAETSQPPTPSVENAEVPAVEQQTVKRKRNSSFGNNYPESPKRANKNDFTVNYVHVKHNKPLRIKNKTILNGDMSPIGNGYASVPTRLLKYMDWSSYTNATRKLLTAVFSRSVLATHSLTGKPSPAFPNKPAKKQLNPALVNDIVQTVVDNCRVPESIVRTSITTKCADESKMLRARMKSPKQKSGSINQENISPPKNKSEDSDESYE